MLTYFLGGLKGKVFSLIWGSIIAQGLGFLFSPIMTRLYSPIELGVFSLFSSFFSLISAPASGRYEFAVFLPPTEEEATTIALLSFFVRLLFSFLLIILQFTVLPNFLHYWNLDCIRNFLWLLPLCIMVVGIFSILRNLSLRNREYEEIAKTKIWQTLGSEGFKLIGPICFSGGSFWLILSFIVGQSAGMISLLRLRFKEFKNSLQKGTIGNFFVLLNKYKQFPIFSVPASILNTAVANILPIFLNAFYGPETVGEFSLASLFISAPTILLTNSVSSVWTGEASSFLHKDAEKLTSLFWKITKKLTIFSFFLIPLGLLSPWMVPLIFGKKWANAGWFAFSLVYVTIGSFIVSPTSTVVTLAKRQDIGLVLDIFRAGVSFFSLFIVWRNNGDKFLAIWAYSLSGVGVYLIWFAVFIFLLNEIKKNSKKITP
ncbi:MAG: oligosaccharide flippase family protein [Candidatus Riflebacteria bacterium]|nr:oligosaccharide flippase family protein [Candidatus Riflebacteria bacterium]